MARLKSPGRPLKTDARPQLVKVTFKADAETMAALGRLTARTTRDAQDRPRSAAIRRAILDADERSRR